MILLLIIIAIPLVLALFIEKDYDLEREVVINVSNDRVFNHVKFLKNHDDFSVWAKRDTLVNTSYVGTDGTVGFVYKWDSNNSDVGTGEQEIVAIQEGKQIDYELRFIEPMASKSTAYMRTDSLGADKTKLVWGFEGHMSYPMNVLLLFVDMESMLGDDLQQGLDILKKQLEAQPKLPIMGTKAYIKYYHEKISDSLIASVQLLSSAQLHFKPAADRWSIAQNLDHIIKSEKLLLDTIKKEMEKDAQPKLLDSIGVDDGKILSQLSDRTKSFQAPKVLEGTDKYENVDSAIADYKEIEKAILKFANDTDIEAMRTHQSVYPFGNSDVYQALLSLAGHTARHTEQIQQVKTNDGFPNS